MLLKTYLQLSIPIFIQKVNASGETETKDLEALTSIQKILKTIDQHTVILAWHPKLEDTLSPLKTVDFVKVMTKKYTNMFQIRP